jgi:uncharacterized membrane protein YphA (DoxX/SURF4 family)
VKYGIWFLRLILAAWMIPTALNHFVRLFPQPRGNEDVSYQLIMALMDTRLFDLIKAVELLVGLCVLFGFYTPLALLVALPISFCVFYWNAVLEGWDTTAARYGYAVLGVNLLLCAAYIRTYLPMFAPGVRPRTLLPFGRQGGSAGA